MNLAGMQLYKTFFSKSKGRKHITLVSKFPTKQPKPKTIGSMAKLARF